MDKRTSDALESLLEEYYSQVKTILALSQEEPEPVEPDPEPVDPVDPIDPVEPVEPGEFRAFDYARNTADQNKLIAIPRIRAGRKSRTQVENIPSIKGGDWTVGDLVRENLESKVVKGYRQWNHNVHRNNVEGGEGRPGSYLWKNIGVGPELEPLADQLKWGTREYNVGLRMFVDCDFTDIPKEHGLYVSNYAGTEISNCTFLRCGSQGVQWAHRELPYQQYKADTLPYQSKPKHVLRDSHFVDNALGGDRRSYNATFFNPGTSDMPGSLLVENCSFVANWPEASFYNNKELRSTGGLVVAHSQGNPPLKDQNMMEKVHIRNCLFDFTKGDRGLVSIRSCDEVLLEDCVFIAREHSQPHINIDPYLETLGNTKTKIIRIKNCVGIGGMKLRLELADGIRYYDVNTYGTELVIDGTTGELLRR